MFNFFRMIITVTANSAYNNQNLKVIWSLSKFYCIFKGLIFLFFVELLSSRDTIRPVDPILSDHKI